MQQQGTGSAICSHLASNLSAKQLFQLASDRHDFQAQCQLQTEFQDLLVLDADSSPLAVVKLKQVVRESLK